MGPHLEHASESLEGLIKHRELDPTPELRAGNLPFLTCSQVTLMLPAQGHTLRNTELMGLSQW